ncbi:MAG: hypothetical protein SF162_11665 [bacterium]|nr:hypothetical protein [bacterium]
MPGLFEITPSTSTVVLDINRQGTVTFTVKNTSKMRIRGVARLVVTPPETAAWYTVQAPPAPPPENGQSAPADPLIRDFTPDGTHTYAINIAVPPTAAPGEYRFRLVVANEANPDDEFTESAEVAFTVAPAAAKPPTKFPVWIIPVILVVLAIIVGAVLLLSRTPEPPPPIETPTPTGTLTPTALPVTATLTPTPTPTLTRTPLPTPFGGALDSQLAFMSYRQGGVPNIFVMTVGESNVSLNRLSFPSNVTSGNSFSRGHNAWSPTGDRIAFMCAGTPDKICIMNADGTGFRQIADFRGGSDPDLSWSADGTRIIYNCLPTGTTGSQVCSVNLTTLAVTSLTPNGGSDDFDPDISPDGELIAFVSRRGGLRQFTLFVMPANGSRVTQLGNGADSDSDPDFSPDSTQIAFSRNNRLFVINVDGSGLRQVGNSTGVLNPNWSPDGTQIAYQVNCDDDGVDCDIAVINADGRGARVLDSNSGSDFGPIWRPRPRRGQ